MRLTPARSPMDGLCLACRSSDAVQKVFIFPSWSQPPLPLNRMFAAGARERQWPKCELTQSLLADQRRELIQPLLSEHRRYPCFNVGTRELRRLFLSEHRRFRRCNDGYRGKCALGWSGNDGKREQRALAGLSVAAQSHDDLRAVSRPAVMPQCARRWCGLPPQSLVLSCTPGSQTIVLAVPSDRTAATSTGSAATPPTQQHVAGEGEFRPAPRLSRPMSQDAY